MHKHTCGLRTAKSEGTRQLITQLYKGWSFPYVPWSWLRPGSKSGQGVKGCFWCRSSGQLRTIFKLGKSGQDINVLRVRIAHSVVKCVRSNGQGPICGAVKRSSNKNDGQNFWALVAAMDYSAYRSDHPLTLASRGENISILHTNCKQYPKCCQNYWTRFTIFPLPAEIVSMVTAKQ